MRPPVPSSPSRWGLASSAAGAAIAAETATGHTLALQNADDAVGEAEPLGHHRDHIAEQSLAQVRPFHFDFLVSLRGQFIEHARRFSLDGGAARPVRDQAHFADRRMLAEAP